MFLEKAGLLAKSSRAGKIQFGKSEMNGWHFRKLIRFPSKSKSGGMSFGKIAKCNFFG